MPLKWMRWGLGRKTGVVVVVGVVSETREGGRGMGGTKGEATAVGREGKEMAGVSWLRTSTRRGDVGVREGDTRGCEAVGGVKGDEGNPESRMENVENQRFSTATLR